MRCNSPRWILMHGMACIDRPTALWNGFGRVHHKPMGQPFQIFPAKFFATKVGQHMGSLVYTSGVDIAWLCPRLMVWLNPTKNYSLGFFWNDYVLACGGWLCFLGVVFGRDRLVKRAGEIKRTFMVAGLVAVTGNRLQLSTLLLLPDLDAP